jgi:YbbR domain-containing protein
VSRRKDPTIGSLGRSPARSGPAKDPIEMPTERGPIRRWVHAALFENVALKFLSMVLAVTVFLLVNTDRDREKSGEVGVTYTLPDDRVLTSPRIELVQVTIRGSARRLSRFQVKDVAPVNLDLRKVQGGEVAITPDMIHVPAGLQVVMITPRSVPVSFDKRIEKIIEVTPVVTGHPQHGYKVGKVIAVPAMIKVRGGTSLLAALSAVRTQEVSVENRTAGVYTENPPLVLPEHVDPEGSSAVSVQVDIVKDLETKEIPNLVVELRGEGVDPAKWKLKQTDVDVTLTGETLAIEKAKPKPVVKIVGTDQKEREVPVTIEGLPPGVGYKVSPEHVTVTPVAPSK